MSNDELKRSKKIVLVAHCLLNANSKVEGLEEFDSVLKELIIFLIKKNYGIIQMPCPELTVSGIKRWGKVKEQYDNPFYRQHCRKLTKDLINQVEDYIENDYTISAVIGVEKSPSCGINQSCSAANWGGNISNMNPNKLNNCSFIAESGVFIDILKEEFNKKDIKVPFLGIDELNIEASIKKLEKNSL